MEGTSNRLYVTESPIDSMSHAALSKMHNINYMQDHRISLGNLSDKALEWYLRQHPEIKQIIFALDNDIDGKTADGLPCNYGQEAAKKFAAKYAERGYDTAVQTPKAKDFNDELLSAKAQIVEQTIEQENEDSLEI